ncbi:MAG: NAD(P)-dependent glycerol-3-phosphate dehydrogenase [Devosiaceae bacterium]|nr:NAD(P)-dependent glycerol-3-phosphate dehydrogenase [Devosiaceae bacterium]
MSKVGIIGAGAWGTALAQAAASAGNQVMIIGRDEKIVSQINDFHCNKKYLGEQQLISAITASAGFSSLKSCELIILAVPAQKTRTLLKALPQNIKCKMPVVLTAKGFEKETLALQSQILEDEWPKAIAMMLSGPSFAVDVAAQKPTAITLASIDARALNHVGKILASASFRPYFSTDPKGVELCGGLKNIYALACGAIEGAGLGLSARSAFISRATIEMGRIVEGFGGERATISALAGIGDLVLSCTSEQSRNYRYGIELGKGKFLAEILDQSIGLVEGVASTAVAHKMVCEAKIDAPLVKAVNHLLNGDVDISTIVEQLMTRPLKSEG